MPGEKEGCRKLGGLRDSQGDKIRFIHSSRRLLGRHAIILSQAATHRPTHGMHRDGHTPLQEHTHGQAAKAKTQEKAPNLKAMFIQNHTKVASCNIYITD